MGKSFFQRQIDSAKRSYKVELEINVRGNRMPLVLYAKAWSKKRAEKAALAASLKEIKVKVNQVTAIKGR